jgi:hypothetical protein
MIDVLLGAAILGISVMAMIAVIPTAHLLEIPPRSRPFTGHSQAAGRSGGPSGLSLGLPPGSATSTDDAIGTAAAL